MTEATAAFEAGEEWAADGAKTAASWLSARCRVPRVGAKRRVRLGRTLRHLPDGGRGVARRGHRGATRPRPSPRRRRHRTEASMARDEEMLVAQAKELGFEDFSRALDYWKQLADPDGAEASDEERKASRDVFLESSLGGMWLGQMTWTPSRAPSWRTSSTASSTTSSRPTVPRPKNAWGARRGSTSWPAPRASAGPTPWSKWRRGAAPPPPRASAPHRCFRVFVGYETMRGRICELENGTVLAPVGPRRPGWTRPTSSGPCSRWATGSTSACARGSSPVGPEGPSSCETGSARTPIATSPPRPARSTTSRPTPRAAQTTQDNGRLLCGFHNRLRNQRERSTRR